MAICCGFFAIAQAASATFAILAILVAVVVLSVAENIQEVAAWELSAELSPEAARARYLGAFSLGFSGQKVIGPTLLVVVLMPTGLIAWPALAGAFGAAALDLANSGTPLSRRADNCHRSSYPSPTHRGEIMREHVLVVGSGRDLPARVRRARPGTETSVICRLEFVAKLRELTEHTRVIAVRDDAPDEEWVALAMAAHELHPFSRIATFGETDQDRCAVIGEALGIATHSPRTVELVHDKQAMRARLRETGVDTTASAVVADLADLTAFVDEHGFPCVVKPVAGSGSAGVAVVRDRQLTRVGLRASQRPIRRTALRGSAGRAVP